MGYIMNTSFSPEVAYEHGVNAAVILGDIEKRLEMGEVNPDASFDGTMWCDMSVYYLANCFYFMTVKQTERALKDLLDSGIVKVRDHKEPDYKWYTIDWKLYKKTVVKGLQAKEDIMDYNNEFYSK